MSDSVTPLASALAAMQATATRQALQTEIVRQQAQAEAAVVELLRDAAAVQASLPPGQGAQVDITA